MSDDADDDANKPELSVLIDGKSYPLESVRFSAEPGYLPGSDRAVRAGFNGPPNRHERRKQAALWRRARRKD